MRNRAFIRRSLAYTAACEQRAIDVEMTRGKAAEHDVDDAGWLLERLGYRIDRDQRCRLQRIAIDARADRRKRDARQLMLGRDLERPAIARREQFRLAMYAVLPHRTDRMNHVTRAQ